MKPWSSAVRPARGGAASITGITIIIAAALALTPSVARAQSTGTFAYVAPTSEDRGTEGSIPEVLKEEAPRPRLGVTIDVGVESAFVARGLNVLQKGSQLDQNPIVAPSLSWAIGDSGLSVGFVGTYQWAGDNREELVKAGVGNQQDINLMYERKISGPVTAYLGLTYTFFPFADPSVAGTQVPSILEPKVAVSLHTAVDLGLQVAYTGCLQDAIAGGRQLYIHPVVWKTFEIDDKDAVDISLSGGAKIWNDPTITDNLADVQADIVYSRSIGGSMHAKPGVHYAWTNLDGVPFEKQHVVWVSLHGDFQL